MFKIKKTIEESIHELKAKDNAKGGTECAKKHRIPLDQNSHPNNRKCRCGHTCNKGNFSFSSKFAKNNISYW